MPRLNRAKQTPAQRLDDALADAETFLESTIGEVTETMAHLRRAKSNIHMQRMTLKRLALPKLPKQAVATSVQARWPSLLPKREMTATEIAGLDAYAPGADHVDDVKVVYDDHEAKLAQDQVGCLRCSHKHVSHALGGGGCYMEGCSCVAFL